MRCVEDRDNVLINITLKFSDESSNICNHPGCSYIEPLSWSADKGIHSTLLTAASICKQYMCRMLYDQRSSSVRLFISTH